MAEQSTYSSLQQSTADLWIEFTRGDDQAFSLLYSRFYQKLFSYAVNLGMDRATAGDGIQELFLKLYAQPGLVKTPETLSSFLFRSIKNYFLNILKHEERNIALEHIGYSFSFDYTIDEKLIAEDEQNEIKQKIDHLLGTLTARQREIIYFRFLHEMEYEEIARIMDISEQGARNMIYKAFEKIRKNNPEMLLILLFHIRFI